MNLRLPFKKKFRAPYGRNNMSEGLLNQVEVDDSIMFGRNPDFGLPGYVGHKTAEDCTVWKSSDVNYPKRDWLLLRQNRLNLCFTALTEGTNARHSLYHIDDVH